jgi:glycosyltransferase involved in cell wall biosynthesis
MSGRIAAVLVVPHGTHRPEVLAAAIAAHHPTWEVGAVWCGDPQLRPQSDGVAWLDGGADEVELIAGDPLVGEWLRAVAVTTRLLQQGFDSVVVLWVGATAVLSSLDGLVAESNERITLVPRAIEGLADDGLAPTESDLISAGSYSTGVAVFGSAGIPALEWLETNLPRAVNVGLALSRLAQRFDAQVCADESIGVGKWRWNCTRPALLDVAGYDTRTPRSLDAAVQGPMRIELIGNPQRQQEMAEAASQLAGVRTPLRLPGGLVVDDVIRQVVAEATLPPPPPWSAAAEFRTWLAPRYWRALHATRGDLSIAFPEPDGRSATAFRRWCRGSMVEDGRPPLIEPPHPTTNPVVVAAPLRDDGVNLVGYFTHSLGLGDVARRLRDAVGAADLPSSAVAVQRTASPAEDIARVENRVEFTNSLCVVTADQFPFLANDFPELFAATRRMIGYWFWELEYLPLPMRQSIALVDEIWAGTKFVTDAFAAVAPVPVRHVPIPVAEPQPSSRSRNDFAVLADAGQRPVFLAAFDHLSVTERKNPVGLIEAFRVAFTVDEGPLLVIKTMNAHHRWTSHQRVLAAADGRADIRVWDEALTRADQMALVAAADCMVSLHRSEGLGLHLAEAMWLGTPTIATRYSGNLDFMTDDNSLLIDADLVHVEHGEGVYPPSAKWAAPDLAEAAAAMRRIVSDSSLASTLSAAGRASMQQQPSLLETGRLISQLLLGRE